MVVAVIAAWSAGAGLGFLVALPLGPIGLLCIRNVLRHGVLPGFAIGTGAALVDVGYAGLGLAGVGKLLDIPALRIVLGLTGAAALMVIGARALRTALRAAPDGAEQTIGDEQGGGPNRTVEEPGSAPSWAALRISLAATASNPATIGYWAAAFAAASAADLTRTLADAVSMLVGVGCGTLLWFSALSLGTALFHRRLGPRLLRGVDLVAGAGIVVFGGLLAVRALG